MGFKVKLDRDGKISRFKACLVPRPMLKSMALTMTKRSPGNQVPVDPDTPSTRCSA